MIVKVRDLDNVYPGVWLHDQLLQEGDNCLVFVIPSKYKRDMQMFLQGRYSEMSEESKDCIRTFSGLSYRKESTLNNGSKSYETDARLLALTKDPNLREKLEQELNVRLDNRLELISPPRSTELWVELEEPA